MHINMKYYIVSIGAIFISLGIGMLVGFNLNYDEEITKQQEAMIGDLNVRFEELKETNHTLEKDLKFLQENYDNSINFINKNVDSIIKDKLIDKNIGILSTNQENNYNEELKDVLTNAGAEVSFDITLMNNIFNSEKVKELSEVLQIEFKNSKEVLNYIVTCLKEDLAYDKLNVLQEIEIIKINYISDSYKNYSSVVLAGGNNGELSEKLFNTVDKQLIEILKNENKHIVGVERSDSKFSYSKLYLDSKVSSVDNIETSIGKLSLVMLLEDSNILGKFGVGEDSDSLIPYKKQ